MAIFSGIRFAAVLILAILANDVVARDFARMLREHAKRTGATINQCVTDEGTFEHDEEIPTEDPCERCTCYAGFPLCMAELCDYPMCVDTDKGPDDCCGRCPNGPNCFLDGEIIPAGDFFTAPGESSGCTRYCRCPEHAYVYIETENNTPADCMEVCDVK